ncbi:MAG: acyl dehydratase [Brevundimonas sp.]
MTEPADPLHFEDIQVGQVIPIGACAVDGGALDGFIERFAPHWPAADGAPEAMVYALWRRLADEAERGMAISKGLAVDALRFMRHPPVGELLRGRMTVMGKDPVGDTRGVVIAQHDLLDEDGRLVFSCLTRTLLMRR